MLADREMGLNSSVLASLLSPCSARRHESCSQMVSYSPLSEQSERQLGDAQQERVLAPPSQSHASACIRLTYTRCEVLCVPR